MKSDQLLLQLLFISDKDFVESHIDWAALLWKIVEPDRGNAILDICSRLTFARSIIYVIDWIDRQLEHMLIHFFIQ
jgi:hypothetical protein